ncbi:MAG: sigma-70 family RNA polymerase sigma factor, partial [Pyrinomonadaceae bacterium]
AKKVRPYKGGEAEERGLVEAAQRDPLRFADLYDNYFESVYAYVARRARDRAEIEDLTAEVFRKALANLPRFRWTGAPFAAWLFRIASNMIADRAKRMAKEGHVPLDDNLAAPAGERLQSSLEEVERVAHMFRMVGELAEDHRRVLVMRFAEEKSISEIANALGRSEGAVKQLQFRAIRNLRVKVANTSNRNE